MSARWLTSTLLPVLLAAGCGTSPPTAPDPVTSATLTGTWSGDVHESYGGRGRLRLVLEQVQVAVTGTFQLEFDDATRNREGLVSGNVETDGLAARVQFSSPYGLTCGSGQPGESFLQVTWIESPGRLSGRYTGFGCVGTITGTFDVRRE